MKQALIINADDFGISRGVNQAIIMAHKEGILNSTSILINAPYTLDAIQQLSFVKSLNVGLHLNLTNASPISTYQNIPLLVNQHGLFKNGFLKLLCLSILKPKELQQQILIEAEAQIQKALSFGITLSHIDSHRHVHMIPVIFHTIRLLAKKYNIPRIRVINENIFYTLAGNKDVSWIFDGGIIKYKLLRLFAMINHYPTNTYFYSILYTGKIFKNRLKNLRAPNNFSTIEVMVHPNIKGIDQENDCNIFDKNVFSPNRLLEMDAIRAPREAPLR